MEIRIKLNLDSLQDLVNEALKIMAGYGRISGFSNIRNDDGHYTARLLSPYGPADTICYSNIFEFIDGCNFNGLGMDAKDAVVRAILEHAHRDDILDEEDAFYKGAKIEKTLCL